ncbi:MAG TPA: septum site-determining protein MinC [Clostridiales bacterium]|nr:septum site-determining protein MinC [Clostridiales bacterium]
MTQQPVVFKGTRKGLSIYIANDAKIEDIRSAADSKLKSGKPFFDGATVNLTFLGREFNSQEQSQLLELFAQYMKIGTVEFTQAPARQEEYPSDDHYNFFDGIEEGMARFVRGTVRSGQRIFYEGNIVVIGDVNPGGEVIAGGNILVLGTLRGIAYAGATGNSSAVVASYCLQPTQLRIAGYITRAPEGETIKPPYPEVAYIKGDQLIIEPYLPGKGKQAESILQTKV